MEQSWTRNDDSEHQNYLSAHLDVYCWLPFSKPLMNLQPSSGCLKTLPVCEYQSLLSRPETLRRWYFCNWLSKWFSSKWRKFDIILRSLKWWIRVWKNHGRDAELIKRWLVPFCSGHPSSLAVGNWSIGSFRAVREGCWDTESALEELSTGESICRTDGRGICSRS